MSAGMVLCQGWSCQKYHLSRVPAGHLTYLTIPTVYFSNLPQPRTKTLFGCNKTLAILKYFLAKYPEQAWLVLVDDDTILSVARLRTMLACYRDIEEPIILGFSVILPI